MFIAIGAFTVLLVVGSWWMYRPPRRLPHGPKTGDGNAVEFTEQAVNEMSRIHAIRTSRNH